MTLFIAPPADSCMADFRKLVVWQKAHTLALDVDGALPRIARKKKSLATQLERAADSVPALIAEGRGRNTDADFAHFITMAIGSATEVENHVQRAYDAHLMPENAYTYLTRNSIEVRKMLIGLRKTLLAPRNP